MIEKLEQIKNEALGVIQEIKSDRDFEHAYNKYLGRKGLLPQLLREIKNLSVEEKKTIGRHGNGVRAELEQAFHGVKQFLGGALDATEGSNFDPTQPGKQPAIGHLHPISQMLTRIEDVFSAMNFQLIGGPDIETDYYNFQALNMPPEHPARDMQDTFYLVHQLQGKNRLLLRTQTSSGQARFMEKHQPPIRVIISGACFRRDDDLTHTPMFHQFEGLVIDRGITMAHLKSVLKTGISELLEQDVDIRFRISYFPFVEPGAEYDVTCTICGGKGCRTCKQTGWVEMGGCGMVHPAVLKNVGYDPVAVQGFAWGFGVERVFMMKHRIPSI
ncbi:MAG: phenylalanine--tRNA ligase subunit alpha, partial [Patescibacteria group bacterium]